MCRNQFKRYILLLFAISLCHLIQAQFVGEIGLLGGVSYYNGDANSTTPFLENHPALGGLFRVKLNQRMSLKADVLRGAVSGNTENFPNKYPEDVQAQFKRNFWEAGVQFELNFFKYGPESWDREVFFHTPYILIGSGLTIYQGQEGNTFAPNLVFGAGYKYKLLDRLNIGIEWSMRKLFRDDFDVTDPSNEILDDPYGVGYSWIKNNDWYSCAFVFITLDIIKIKGRCIEMRY
jgi:hypothetical protein